MTIRRRYAWKRDPEKLLKRAKKLWAWECKARTWRQWAHRAEKHNKADTAYIHALCEWIKP